MKHPLGDQRLALAADAAAIFLLGGWHPDHRADTGLSALVGHQCADQRLAVDPVGLRTATPTRDGNRGGIDDMAFDPVFLAQHPIDPESVETGFLNHHERIALARARLRLLAQLTKARKHSGDVAACNGVSRHFLSAAR